jgi:hypothetical protein
VQGVGGRERSFKFEHVARDLISRVATASPKEKQEG